MRLSVHIEGAADQDQERAVAAAWQVFEDARTHPYEAAAAVFKMEGETEDLTADEMRLSTFGIVPRPPPWRRAVRKP